jgi:TetR/AcrR family transcriptional regulator
MDKDKIDKKDHILDVAEKIFSDVGYDGASTRMISGEAGVNMAMLNYYFGSKEGLFMAVIERRISSFQNLLQNIGSDDSMTTWAKVEKYIDMYVERVVNNNCFQKLLYQEMSVVKRGELGDRLTRVILQNTSEVKKILKEGVDKGEFNKDIDIELVIAAIYGTKNFVINTPMVSSAMLGFDVQEERSLEEKLKPRMEQFMKKLLKAYLMKENDKSN